MTEDGISPRDVPEIDRLVGILRNEIGNLRDRSRNIVPWKDTQEATVTTKDTRLYAQAVAYLTAGGDGLTLEQMEDSGLYRITWDTREPFFPRIDTPKNDTSDQ